MKKNLVSICLGDGLGYISIGNIIRRYHKSEKIEYVKIMNNSINTYQLNVNKIKTQNTLKVNVTLESILDSVTPFSYFPRFIYRNIIIYNISRYFNKTGRNFSKIFF